MISCMEPRFCLYCAASLNSRDTSTPSLTEHHLLAAISAIDDINRSTDVTFDDAVTGTESKPGCT